MSVCLTSPQFHANDRVVSLVYHHPPEIEPGTKGTIVKPRMGSLYAVQLPDGELHRWFSRFELESLNQKNYWDLLCPGDLAKVISNEGHPHHIIPGTVVSIVKVIDKVPYYDLIIDGKGYHRWLADFEMIPLSVYL